MTKAKTEEPNRSLDDLTALPDRPKPEQVAPEAWEYIEYLEKRLSLLSDELEAKPGAEARGLVWSEVWGIKSNANGDQYPVRVSINARSDVDGVHAWEQLILLIRRAMKDNFSLARP